MGEEPAVTAAPGDRVVADRRLHPHVVVAAVVVDDEQPSVGPQDPVRLGRPAATGDGPRNDDQRQARTSTLASGEAGGVGGARPHVDDRRGSRPPPRGAPRRRSGRSRSVRRAPIAASCAARNPRSASTSATSRPSTGPSAASARGILPSASKVARRRDATASSDRGKGVSDTASPSVPASGRGHGRRGSSGSGPATPLVGPRPRRRLCRSPVRSPVRAAQATTITTASRGPTVQREPGPVADRRRHRGGPAEPGPPLLAECRGPSNSGTSTTTDAASTPAFTATTTVSPLERAGMDVAASDGRKRAVRAVPERRTRVPEDDRAPRTNARRPWSHAAGPPGTRAGSRGPGRPPSRSRPRSRRTAAPASVICRSVASAQRCAVAAGEREEARRVVARQQVELDGDDVRVVGVEQLVQARRERGGVHRPDVVPVLVVEVEDAPVQVRARGEPEDRLGQRVVHERVEPVARAPTRARCARSRRRCRPPGPRPARGAGTRARTAGRRSPPARRGASRRCRRGASARRPRAASPARAGRPCSAWGAPAGPTTRGSRAPPGWRTRGPRAAGPRSRRTRRPSDTAGAAGPRRGAPGRGGTTRGTGTTRRSRRRGGTARSRARCG